MAGDLAAIRRLAAGFRNRAADMRVEADRTVARAEGVGWLGQAGDALRSLAVERALSLRRSATLHELAAESLDRHASEVHDARSRLDADGLRW